MNPCDVIQELKALNLELIAQLPSLTKAQIKEKLEYIDNRYAEFQNANCP